MFLILLALCVLAVSAAGLGLLAFARPTPATTRLADLFGPLGAACGCAAPQPASSRGTAAHSRHRSSVFFMGAPPF